MARSKTSQRWLKEHFDDPYVKMAQMDGYRSRASYKLLEIQEKDRIPDVTFIQGDFTDDAVFAQILEAIGENPVDLVISDMAPNISRVRTADQARAM